MPSMKTRLDRTPVEQRAGREALRRPNCRQWEQGWNRSPRQASSGTAGSG